MAVGRGDGAARRRCARAGHGPCRRSGPRADRGAGRAAGGGPDRQGAARRAAQRRRPGDGPLRLARQGKADRPCPRAASGTLDLGRGAARSRPLGGFPRRSCPRGLARGRLGAGRAAGPEPLPDRSGRRLCRSGMARGLCGAARGRAGPGAGAVPAPANGRGQPDLQSPRALLARPRDGGGGRRPGLHRRLRAGRAPPVGVLRPARGGKVGPADGPGAGPARRRDRQSAGLAGGPRCATTASGRRRCGWWRRAIP